MRAGDLRRVLVERLAGALCAVPVAPLAADFADVLRLAAVLRLAGAFVADDLLPPPLPLLLLLREDDEDEDDEPPSAHLPLITRCAASATASAMSEPNLVALDIMLEAALLAVSAASSPASRIALRALGLAAIAAAAAVRPAASISLLIAALASFSVVLPPDLADDLELFLVEDFAIDHSLFA